MNTHTAALVEIKVPGLAIRFESLMGNALAYWVDADESERPSDETLRQTVSDALKEAAEANGFVSYDPFWGEGYAYEGVDVDLDAFEEDALARVAAAVENAPID